MYFGDVFSISRYKGTIFFWYIQIFWQKKCDKMAKNRIFFEFSTEIVLFKAEIKQ